ncbi:glutamate--cysteine ligase [Limosilactobacillus panis]|uniref:Glutamate--cysteine ligase n=1 Tax=Limosilactobacillus panis TaxID=47493 RepID=A0ABT7VMY1_9LACO|nr:glutamate--cysteine ligase [Limosilactobacillus panis]MDM8333486.1 glutamate--cysteine ligase [Limosilactobacillus panis]
MFSRIGQAIYDSEAVAKISDFTVGLEIEMQRIDEAGNLSQEPYPAGIGDEQTNPWITNDFLETMSETVTPSAKHSLAAMHYLYRINNCLRSALAPGEMLWPLSMPPRLPKDKSKLVLAKMGPKKEAYLKEWAKRHGYSQGTPCGAHISLSIDQHVIDLVLKQFADQFSDERAVRNHLYTVVAQGFVRYRWLLTYLFGASPVAETGYFSPGQELPHPIRSIRQSRYGFGTKFTGDYTNLAAYIDRIEAGVKQGILTSDYEFHGPVRFKGNPDLKKLPEKGIEYLELRMLDLDPSSSVGIRTGTVRFIRLLASYFIMHPALKATEVNPLLGKADQMNQTIAEELPTAPSRYQATALAVIRHLERYANQIQLGPEYAEILEDLEDRVVNPATTPSARLLNYLKEGSLEEYALRRARRYQRAALEQLHSFRGFEDGRIYTAEELRQALAW